MVNGPVAPAPVPPPVLPPLVGPPLMPLQPLMRSASIPGRESAKFFLAIVFNPFFFCCWSGARSPPGTHCPESPAPQFGCSIQVLDSTELLGSTPAIQAQVRTESRQVIGVLNPRP